MDDAIAELARRDRDLGREILRELVRVPADHVDRPEDEGGDPLCGLSNHEGPRLELLRRFVLEHGAVDSADDVGIDDFGNLWWEVSDPSDGVPPDERTVVYLDGHVDTVKALRDRWRETCGEGVDAYEGLTDPERVDTAFLADELGWLPDRDDWDHVLFGRGTADQLGGVVSQLLATRILRELRDEGALEGVTVRSYATVAEEDNDGGGPMYLVREELPGADPERVPDAVILTEGTGHAEKGACGIYRGQRGRMTIEVRVHGRSCHGSMPWEGKNPLEHGARIIAEAAEHHREGRNIGDHPFLGKGTRTASWADLETPSDCAVPERFTFRFDRRLTVGEDPEAALAAIEELPSVARARADGLRVEVAVPTYETPTWTGAVPGNPQIYAGWITPEDHPAIGAALEAYGAVAPGVVPEGGAGLLRREPRLSRWIFSTDGVGFPVPADDESIPATEEKGWIASGAFKHPAMFGIGPGMEQNTHKIGECVDTREIGLCAAVIARFPRAFREATRG